jgi:hypothetical protein
MCHFVQYDKLCAMTAKEEPLNAFEASASSTSARNDGTSVIVETVYGIARFYRFFHIDSVAPPALTPYEVSGSSNEAIHKALLSLGLNEEFLVKLTTRGQKTFPDDVLHSTLLQFGQREDWLADSLMEICEFLDEEYVSLYFYPRGATPSFRKFDIYIVINHTAVPVPSA